jgi:hypothetical protein
MSSHRLAPASKENTKKGPGATLTLPFWAIGIDPPPPAPVHPWSPVGMVDTSSNGLEPIGGDFARTRVGDQFETDLLTFAQVAHARPFDRGDMNKGILAAVIRLYETETFFRIEPLYRTYSHDAPLRCKHGNPTSRREIIANLRF